MSANVETMFYVREKPWHGLGTEVQEAPTSTDALIYAGLDWEVVQKDVYTEDGTQIAGYKVNTRSTDDAALGIVSDRYKVVQNSDAFRFTDDLLGAGVVYETAGALQCGRKVWMLARMPHRYIVGKNGYRFVNAVSDFATHADPIRKTRNYNENLFLRTVEGNPMIDRAYKMVLATA